MMIFFLSSFRYEKKRLEITGLFHTIPPLRRYYLCKVEEFNFPSAFRIFLLGSHRANFYAIEVMISVLCQDRVSFWNMGNAFSQGSAKTFTVTLSIQLVSFTANTPFSLKVTLFCLGFYPSIYLTVPFRGTTIHIGCESPVTNSML